MADDVPTQGSQFLGSGYLSNACGPFALGTDPARPGFTVRDLSLPEGVNEQRFESRKTWKQLVDQHFSGSQRDDSLATMDSFYQRAYDLLASPASRDAFSLKGETEATKDLYGFKPWGPIIRPSAGARFLVARRLVEAGCRFVTATYGAWDTHSYHYRSIETMMPDLDKAFAGLIRDLDDRGMLDTTLVLITSEFGRTPKVNAGGGRDHWPRVFSIVMAGGGIKRGQVFWRIRWPCGRAKERSAVRRGRFAIRRKRFTRRWTARHRVPTQAGWGWADGCCGGALLHARYQVP